MPNPWKPTLWDRFRKLLELKTSIFIIGFMVGLFLIWFAGDFLVHLQDYLNRKFLDKPWGK